MQIKPVNKQSKNNMNQAHLDHSAREANRPNNRCKYKLCFGINVVKEIKVNFAMRIRKKVMG